MNIKNWGNRFFPELSIHFFFASIGNASWKIHFILGKSAKMLAAIRRIFVRGFDPFEKNLLLSIHMSYITFQSQQSKMLSPLGKFRKEIIFKWNPRAVQVFQKQQFCTQNILKSVLCIINNHKYSLGGKSLIAFCGFKTKAMCDLEQLCS